MMLFRVIDKIDNGCLRNIKHRMYSAVGLAQIYTEVKLAC